MLRLTRPLLGVILCLSITESLRAQGELAIPQDPAGLTLRDLLVQKTQVLPLGPVSPPEKTKAAADLSLLASADAVDAYDSYSSAQVLRRTFQEIKTLETRATRRRVLNDVYIKPDKDKEYEKVREAWKDFFGGRDVWAPYYKAKEIEDWVKERVSFRVLKTKCKPKFDKDGFVYVCKSRF